MTAHWRLLVRTFAGMLVCAAPATAAECLSVFDPFQVLKLHLQLSSTDWDKIRKDTTFEVEVPARFWAEGEDPVGISVSVRRKRGVAIPSETNPQKVPLKIDVNEFVDQKWRDLIKVSLENGGGSAGSPYKAGGMDVVREGLAWAVHRMASGSAGYGYLYEGEPSLAPKASAAACASWVRLYVNGIYKGVYVNAEQRDKQFLKNRGLWTAGSTWFYEQEDVGTALLEEGDGDSPTFTHLCYAPFRPKGTSTCVTPPDAVLATDLPDWVNMQALLAACAADAIADNNDGLCSHGNNMFFADFLGGQSSLGGRTRMYFPWDLDSVFGGSSANSSIYVRNISRKGVITQSPYQSVILNHHDFRIQYNDILTTLIDDSASKVNLQAFLDGLKGTDLVAALATDPYPTVTGSVTGHLDKLRTWISSRIDSIRNQLAANGPPAPRP